MSSRTLFILVAHLLTIVLSLDKLALNAEAGASKVNGVARRGIAATKDCVVSLQLKRQFDMNDSGICSKLMQCQMSASFQQKIAIHHLDLTTQETCNECCCV